MSEFWQLLAIVGAVMVVSYLVVSIIFALLFGVMFGTFTGGKKD